jgi:hypothetical protein
MMGMTAFRRMSRDFARLAVRHVRGGEPTNGRQGKSAAFGRAHVVGRIEVFWHHVTPPCWRLRPKHQAFQQTLRHRRSDVSGNNYEQT